MYKQDGYTQGKTWFPLELDKEVLSYFNQYNNATNDNSNIVFYFWSCTKTVGCTGEERYDGYKFTDFPLQEVDTT